MSTASDKHKKLELPFFTDELRYKEKSADYIFEGHRHADYELMYVDRGPLNVNVDGAGFLAQTGDLFVFCPGQKHVMWAEKVAPNLVNLAFRFSGGPCRYPGIRRLKRGPVRASQAMREVLSRLLAVAGQKPAASRDLARLYLAELLLLAVDVPDSERPAPSRRVTENGDRRLAAAAEEHIDRHLAEPMHVRDIARAIGVGESTLRHAFKRAAGVTVADRLMEKRIARAKELLRESAMSVTEISACAGYPTIHSFSRAFRRLVRMSPTEYTRSVR